MIKSVSIEAFSVAEAAAKVENFFKVFGEDFDVNLSILAGESYAEDMTNTPLGYSFTWLTNKSGKLGAKVGGIEFNVITDMTKLPQKVASAASAVENAELVGASYKPIIYCGKQTVHGTNYFFIAEQTLDLKEPVKHVVSLTVNELNGEFKLVGSSIKVIY